ncbi:hypothetical protein [Actinocatenispora comari]|uniref:hypothetical protein n=1 Tax=Actinocatenispora comari TaxID=2807577 RepID=UPI001A90DA2F|nr:hypothetical protein [Actinocatenispora comari]
MPPVIAVARCRDSPPGSSGRSGSGTGSPPMIPRSICRSSMSLRSSATPAMSQIIERTFDFVNLTRPDESITWTSCCRCCPGAPGPGIAPAGKPGVFGGFVRVVGVL